MAEDTDPMFKGMTKEIVIQILRGTQAELREANEAKGKAEAKAQAAEFLNKELAKKVDNLTAVLAVSTDNNNRMVGYLARVHEDDMLRDPPTTVRVGDLSQQERFVRRGPSLETFGHQDYGRR